MLPMVTMLAKKNLVGEYYLFVNAVYFKGHRDVEAQQE